MDLIAAPGDYDNDGFGDVIAQDDTGTIWLYQGNGIGGFTGQRWVMTSQLRTSSADGFCCLMSENLRHFPGLVCAAVVRLCCVLTRRRKRLMDVHVWVPDARPHGAGVESTPRQPGDTKPAGTDKGGLDLPGNCMWPTGDRASGCC